MSPLAKSAGLPACRQAGKTCFVFLPLAKTEKIGYPAFAG